MFWQRVKSILRPLFRSSEEDSQDPKAVWCIVANVKDVDAFGEAEKIRAGTKHFSSGAKVYCFPPAWGDGYQKIRVIGRHRSSHRYVKMVLPSKRLTRWRVKLVYSPYLISELKGFWSEGEAREMVKSILKQEKSLQ